jgi:hypothetical protein
MVANHSNCFRRLRHNTGIDAGPLNTVCYMWWDVFPSLALACESQLSILHSSALTTMERILHQLAGLPRERPARAGALAAEVPRDGCADHRQVLRFLSGSRSEAFGLRRTGALRVRGFDAGLTADAGRDGVGWISDLAVQLTTE